MSNLLVWVLRGLLALCLQLRYPAVRFQKEESVRKDPAYAVYETYRYAYERYGYLFSYAEKTEEKENTASDGTEAVQAATENMLSAASLARLQDYDYLMKQYFSVHASTTAERSLMKAERLLETDVGLTKNPDEPQILIYHTHASETYADYGPQNTDADVVGAGTYLTELLRQGSDADRKTLEERNQALTQQRQEKLERQQQIRTRMQTNETIREQVVDKSRDLARREERYRWMAALSDTVNGSLRGQEKVMLETYVQMTFFDRIIRRANRRLLVMSGNQYELRRKAGGENNRSQTGLELEVIDHYNGSCRSVRSLSGGESFQAALSLALGLSDEIQSVSGGVRLDTMFVDEGFGSLDEESLAQAIQALNSLTEGKKLVGIISHVASLKEKIEKQVLVKKDRSGGSRVELVL